MKVVLAGASGFLGRPLAVQLAAHGHDVVVLTRGGVSSDARVRAVAWRPDGTPHSSTGSGPGWAAEIDGAGAIINLAGENIAEGRWTSARKEALRQSRVLSTRSLVAAIRAAAAKPSVLVSGSAVGYYGATGDSVLDESFPPGPDFLATLCVDWEAEAQPAAALGCRVVILRTGVVLAADGGALKKLIPAFKFFAGGPIASGRQYMSWIHRADWLALAEWAINQPTVSGAVNATAPNPVTNAEFSAALGRALHRPSWLRAPRLPLRIMLGEMADVALVGGQRVLPKHALDQGFVFTHPSIDEAMKAAING